MADIESRSIIVSYRVTPAEAAHLDAAGQALNQPRQRADFCRAAALHAAKVRVPEVPRAIRRPGRRKPTLDIELLAKILSQVSAVATNVDQLGEGIRAGGGLPAPALSRLTTDVIQIRNAVRAALDGGARHADDQEGDHGREG